MNKHSDMLNAFENDYDAFLIQELYASDIIFNNQYASVNKQRHGIIMRGNKTRAFNRSAVFDCLFSSLSTRKINE